jgi:hypothetical protein
MSDKEWLLVRFPGLDDNVVYHFIEMVGKFIYDAGMEEEKARELALFNVIGYGK